MTSRRLEPVGIPLRGGIAGKSIHGSGLKLQQRILCCLWCALFKEGSLESAVIKSLRSGQFDEISASFHILILTQDNRTTLVCQVLNLNLNSSL
jgi:hypothetical protein